MGEFPSGQRGQTVNLLSVTSVVRIHPRPPKILDAIVSGIFSYLKQICEDLTPEKLYISLGLF